MLAEFWRKVTVQDDSFSENLLKKLYVLSFAPNGMWTYLVSVYFMSNKDNDCNLDDIKFISFLDKITGFIWAYALLRPGVNALRGPVFPEMINIVNGIDATFKEYKFDEASVRNTFENFEFTNGRPVTKSVLAWWAFENCDQPLPKFDTVFEIEHIYSRKRQEIFV